MPKIIDYPKANLKRALALAEIVDRLGGECSLQSAAEGMGNKVGGAFSALVGATVKYGFISSKSGKIKLEPLFSEYKLAYSEAQKQEALKKAFLSVPLFTSIAKRFENQTLPTHFEKLLIREHQVSADLASRVAAYFEEGAREAGIMQADGTINAWPKNTAAATALAGAFPQALSGSTSSGSVLMTDSSEEASTELGADYTVRITGPGMDTKIAIKDEDDVEIVEIMLKKVKKLLRNVDVV